MADLRRVNYSELVPEYDDTDPDGYRAGMARFGPALGAEKMGASLYELPPGQSICPYHYEYPDEEWLLVVGGRVTVRHEGSETELSSGDMVCFPPGPEGAHKVTCLGDETARVVMLSTKETPAVSSPRHVTLCAPSGPGGKQTRSPLPSSISPPSCRTVTRPSRIRSHSSSGYS